MVEILNISKNVSKDIKYQEIIPQIQSIIGGEEDLVANLANVTAVLNETFQHLWTGFYLIKGTTLVLGPFQGPLACTRIPLHPKPKGACGVAAINQETLIIPNVDEFHDHIVCSSLSKSEIVVPLIVDNKTELVLDIDSVDIGTFDDTDAKYLEDIIEIIKNQNFRK